MKRQKHFPKKVKFKMMKNLKITILCLTIFLGLFYNCSSGDSEPEIVTDKIAPSVPANLTGSNTTQTSVDLSWSASTDNIGVASYLVFKDNVAFSSPSSTSLSVSNLTANTSYSFKVRAKDAAGNESGFSNIITITTQANNVLLTSSGNLETYVGNIIDNAPGNSGNNYSDPSSSQLDSWNITINDILQNNIANAVTKAGELGYQITEFTDTTITPSQIFYVLEKKSSQSNYWGTYVFSKTPERANLVLMAPHSKYDTNTGKQALFCFKNNLAKALLINGTHRCNNSSASSCSGTTSACGSSAAFRVSDMAHTTTSMFQKTTDILFNKISNSVFIQLHGFGKKSSDPYVIMSNGTRETPAVDYAVKIKDALLLEDNSLTFKIAHLDTSWTRLIGFTNTQGRLINSSPNPCSTSSTSTTGRFIHIEQEKTKLREDVNGWTKMSDALKKAFN